MIRKNSFNNIALYKYWLFASLVLLNITMVDAKKKKPSWVDSQISDHEYYIGIGYAPKDKKHKTHFELAKKDALNELASEISVNIFSSNILVSVVKNEKLRNDFNTLIQSRVKAEIEDYELFDTYQTRKGYWVYYRLSKATYRRKELAKKTAATQNSISNFQFALDAEKQLNYKKAIVFYAKSIDAVKMYLNENIVEEINGESVNLVVRSFERIASILSALKIEAENDRISVVFSGDISTDKLRFSLCDNDKNSVSDFPLSAYYSERAIPEANKTTDKNGMVSFFIPKIRSQKKNEVFQVGLDLNAILQESSADYVIRKAILDMPTQIKTIDISVLKPSISISATESNLSKPLSVGMSEPQMKSLCLKYGYEVKQSEADFKCVIITDTQNQSEINGIFTCTLNGEISLIDKTGKTIYSTTISSIKGVQLNPEKAGLEAYKKFVQLMETRYFREIEEAILK